jgi:hypothetical protein
MATWIIDRRELCAPDGTNYSEKERDWTDIAEEVCKEKSPAKLLELTKQLVEALEKKQRGISG